jgi:Protein of unknown function (DUF3141)
VEAVVLNGSPLSYWAGTSGANPMRLLGGSWITNLFADLGNGQFDSAWLIQDRFLEFERWWNGWYSFRGCLGAVCLPLHGTNHETSCRSSFRESLPSLVTMKVKLSAGRASGHFRHPIVQ